jgi:hypothetical protein
MFSVAAGLLAGALHVVLGPDHLAALTPLSLDAPGSAWRAGLRWGLGHAAAVALVCVPALLLREALPLEALSGLGERLVGISLVGLGTWGLMRALFTRLGAAAPSMHAAHGHTAFAFGSLHGIAGSAHLVGVLPALALSSRAATLGYLVAFSVGSVLAMTGFSAALGNLGRLRARRALLACGSAASLGIGCLWLFSRSAPPV